MSVYYIKWSHKENDRVKNRCSREIDKLVLKSNQLNGNAASAVLYTSLELMVGFNGMTNDDHARSDPINVHHRLIIIIKNHE